jgi:perosamine synthetase
MISNKNTPMNEYPLLKEGDGVVLFYPDIDQSALHSVGETLSGRWIGQGPKVEEFERRIADRFLGSATSLAVGSGTDALHLSYLLANIKPGDEILVPSFTCTATNIPLLYIGANIKFLDIDPLTMNISIDDLKRKISDKTRAIVTVDYGGICCEYSEINAIAERYGVPVIQDAAHSIGSKYDGLYVGNQSDFTVFSFQAIKTLTTGDGGMVVMKDVQGKERGKRLRWFGIDREKKQFGIWENDIQDIGYKYQMNDIAAAIGLSNLEKIDAIIDDRKSLYAYYLKRLSHIPGIRVIQPTNQRTSDFCPWLLTVIVEKDRMGLMTKLREHGIESGQVHYRNDRYKIFGSRRNDLPNMDLLEDLYLVLPLHRKMSHETIDRISEIVKLGW